MKARLPGTSPKLSQKEYDKIYTDAANDAARSVIAAVLLVLHRRKWHKDKIQQFYTDVIATMNMPPVFGKELTDIEVRMYLSERYEIDFRKIHINIETCTPEEHMNKILLIAKERSKRNAQISDKPSR